MGKETPRPIKFSMGSGWAKLRVIGINSASLNAYLSLAVGQSHSADTAQYGFIEDRDIKRLRDWCDACLRAKRKAKRPARRKGV